MNTLDTYNSIFIETFQVEEKDLNAEFNVDTIENWDSVCQLSLVTNMEDTFDIMMEPEDIIGFKSYELGKTILAKYDVEII
ncbi:MAG: acyl carrier protein [Flavobacterium sp.]|jgi:acyl carrier protein